MRPTDGVCSSHDLKKTTSIDSQSHNYPGRSTISSQLSPPPASVTSEIEALPDLHHGGIRLKKKASSNFGAPFGQLGPGSFRKH